MSEIISNSPEEINEFLNDTNKEKHFITLCFYHNELPPSLFTAILFQKFKTNYSIETIGNIFLIDITKYSEFASKYGVIASPSIVILWKNNPLLIRRPGWDDATKIIGCLKEDEWLSILRFVSTIPKNEDRKFLLIKF